MGALPKRKISKGRKNRRRSHHALSKPPIVTCGNCGATKLSHFKCSTCGTKGVKKVQVEKVEKSKKVASSKSKEK